MDKIDIEKYIAHDLSFGEPVGEGKVILPFKVIAEKLNEIIDHLNASASQPNCKHNWVPGTSGYYCDKCNKYKV